MKIKSFVFALLGIFGISLTMANSSGAKILSSKMNTKNKSFEETSHGSQDWTVGK